MTTIAIYQERFCPTCSAKPGHRGKKQIFSALWKGGEANYERAT